MFTSAHKIFFKSSIVELLLDSNHTVTGAVEIQMKSKALYSFGSIGSAQGACG